TLSDQNHHESKIWRDMWDILGPSDVALTDRGFNSYEATAQLKAEREVDSVMRLHQRRKVDFRKGKRLGDYDRLQTWLRPQRPKDHHMTKGQWAELPEEFEVRIIRMQVQVPGFRTTEITLVTTLLDEKRYPAWAICELYLKRWRVELYFRDIKVTLGLDVLRCKTPEMVEKEIAMHAVTYNAIRAIMQEAAATHQAPLERVSFKGTVDTLREWASIFSGGKPARRREQLYDQMLGVIAGDLVPERPHRSEPRAKKRRPKIYQLMTALRGQMKVSKSRRNR
ncbi:MAG: IS4 family transposase, partial [bacterium]|nr:IS4 family transposase [bacterium]